MKSFFLLLASVVSGFQYALAGNPQELEQQVKAVCMYNFAKFVDWPQNSSVSNSSELNICFMGEAPMASILEGKKDLEAKGKSIRVTRLQASAQVSEVQSCHLLYWNSNKTSPNAEVMKLIDSSPILSVSEEGEKDAHAIVHFQLIDDRVKFSIQHEKAQQLGLLMSPQLLRLAVKK
jgi:hypothetical protein